MVVKWHNLLILRRLELDVKKAVVAIALHYNDEKLLERGHSITLADVYFLNKLLVSPVENIFTLKAVFIKLSIWPSMHNDRHIVLGHPNLSKSKQRC